MARVGPYSYIEAVWRVCLCDGTDVAAANPVTSPLDQGPEATTRSMQSAMQCTLGEEVHLEQKQKLKPGFEE